MVSQAVCTSLKENIVCLTSLWTKPWHSYKFRRICGVIRMRNNRQQTFMPWERFKLRTPKFAWPKILHTLNHMIIGIGRFQCTLHDVV